MVGKIDEVEALRAADSPNNLRLQIDRYARGGAPADQDTELRLVPHPKLAPAAHKR